MSVPAADPDAGTTRDASLPLAAAVFLLIVLPFLGRAHAIDDPLYLEAARHVVAHPLDPLGGPSFWHDRPATSFDDSYNPPLVAYVLAAPAAIGGGAERPVHVAMAAVALLALVATAAAGRTLGVAPRTTLLLATSPALTLAAVSAMADAPFLLLTVLALGAALRTRGLASGAWVGLGALAKYSGVLGIVPVALRLRGAERLRACVAAAAICAAWGVASLVLYGRFHPSVASRFLAVDGRLLLERGVSFVASLGLVGLPAALVVLRWDVRAVAVALAAGAAGAWGIDGSTVSGGTFLSFACCASGVALLHAAARASWRTRDLFLVTAFWLPALYATTLVYFGAARYALPLLPPLVWLLDRGEALAAASARRWLAAAVAGAIASLALLWGDAGAADAWRTAAARLPAVTRGFEVGHWGFQWYAGVHGYPPLTPRETLQPADVVAEAEGVHAPETWPAQRALLVPHGTIVVPSPTLRVMDRSAGAGLYSSGWGLLPFGFRDGASEVVRLWTPAPWLAAALAQRPTEAVVLDLGSAEAHWTELDGWSGDEAFDDAGVRRTFAWTVGSEAALRVALPPGVQRLALRAFPAPEAEGPLDIALGDAARATVTLADGWRTYEAAVVGTVPGGVTTIVLRPVGCRHPGPFDRERRELAVAVDGIAFGEHADPAGQNRGTWPIVDAAGRSSFAAPQGRRP